MKQLVIIGASGHGKVIADIAKKNNYENICFLDDNENLKKCLDYNVKGTIKDIYKYSECDFIIAIGDSQKRMEIFQELDENNFNIVTLIHPKAIIGDKVIIKKGTVIMAGAVINSCTTVGKGCIINTSSSVDHDCCIEDFVHIAVGAHIAGNVKIKSNTWIGAGAIIINNVEICRNCYIGAGGVVIKNITEAETYVGVPVKKIEKRK